MTSTEAKLPVQFAVQKRADELLMKTSPLTTKFLSTHAQAKRLYAKFLCSKQALDIFFGRREIILPRKMIGVFQTWNKNSLKNIQLKSAEDIRSISQTL